MTIPHLKKSNNIRPALGGTLLILLFLCGCSPQSFFYYPNRTLYADPATAGLPYETVQYPSLNGKKLWALFIPTDQSPKGTVVHFHGNYGNVSNHFPMSLFLLKQGFDVLIFDYQGYGASEGRPSPKHVVEDGIATVRYAQEHLRNPGSGVVVLGQSLGGAAAIVVTAKETLVRGAVIESAFSSYPRMGKAALRRSVWTYPLSFMAPLFLRKSYDPLNYIAEISPRPLFLIHGEKDHIVPSYMSKDLYDKARDPKQLWRVPEADHLECKRKAGKRYEEDIGRFFEAAIARKTKGSDAN